MKKNDNIEHAVIKIITKKKYYTKSFNHITNNFENKLNGFNPVNNCFDIKKYFGRGIGDKTTKELLIKDDVIKREWLNKYKTKYGNIKSDIKGLYIFVHKNVPFYVGISKCLIRRISQHVKGKTHNTSTLAFNIGLLKYKIDNNKSFNGKRDDFNFVSEVEPVKEFLLKQSIAILPINNDEELALFEIYCAMELGTALNTFETH